MPGAAAVFKSAVSKARRPASRRPKSGTQTTQHAETALGAGSNAVAGRVIANGSDQGRHTTGNRII